ncbi:MAG: hypothetical protein CVV12_04755 [Gammaproteobacteria bacterium HGW-Gammaproteobacteria-2]|jgi:gamma-glutamyltranspeptidase|nr:MAG: hypothetical protein CVV12_04755 [Gammaproteobacteria bacterium HGW-Gammaproteobacteria-2]
MCGLLLLVNGLVVSTLGAMLVSEMRVSDTHRMNVMSFSLRELIHTARDTFYKGMVASFLQRSANRSRSISLSIR